MTGRFFGKKVRMNKILLLGLLFYAASFAPAQTVKEGPYTVRTLDEGVYHIEDANDANPSGIVTDDAGDLVRMNNSSDMYLVTGRDRALLIDLSNAVEWDESATDSLRSVVYERVGARKFHITVTHRHGDHLGMLPAFRDDSRANFWISRAEFKGMDIFPKERTEYFAENASFDLGGGIVIDSAEVPGHTDHSTIFFLRGKNLVFTGDAIGSGSGVWLFNKESFFTYRNGIDRLIAYIENPSNRIDPEELEIQGGHAWQRGNQRLTGRYVYDMRTLIERMGTGTAESEPMSAPISFLDTNFKYGTATITWNKKAADEYAESVRIGSDTPGEFR